MRCIKKKMFISAKRGTNVVGLYYAHWFRKKATTGRNNPFISFSSMELYIFYNTNNQSNDFFSNFFSRLSVTRRKIIYVELFKSVFCRSSAILAFCTFFSFQVLKIITILVRLVNCHKDWHFSGLSALIRLLRTVL